MSYGSVDGAEFGAQQAHVEDSLTIQRLSRPPQHNDTGDCLECGEEIPLARRQLIPRCNFCVSCQEDKDKSSKPLFRASNPYCP